MSNRADDLRAELAALEDRAVEGSIHDGEGGIFLIIRGEEFECRRVSVSWQMMQFAKARRTADIHISENLPEEKRKQLEESRNQAGLNMMAVLLDAALILLKPHERERFSQFMDELSSEGLKDGELEDAIGDIIAKVGGEKGKAEQTTSSVSSASLQTTSENVPVISLTPDTVPETPHVKTS